MTDLDPCPLCARPLVPGPSVNRHHLLPKLKGGTESFPAHKICHSKVHSIWSEAELRDLYLANDGEPEKVWAAYRADERVQAFVKWVAKKEPEFRDSNKRTNDHKKRRGRR